MVIEKAIEEHGKVVTRSLEVTGEHGAVIYVKSYRALSDGKILEFKDSFWGATYEAVIDNLPFSHSKKDARETESDLGFSVDWPFTAVSIAGVDLIESYPQERLKETLALLLNDYIEKPSAAIQKDEDCD